MTRWLNDAIFWLLLFGSFVVRAEYPMNTGKYKWLVIGMLWSVCFFDYVDRWGVSALFPLLKKEMHLTPVQLGLLGSVSAWIYGLGAPFAGYVVDRIRRKTAVLGVLFVWSGITAAAVYSHSFHQLLFFMAALGATVTIYMPSAMSMSTVTIRFRDSMEQVRVPMAEIAPTLKKAIREYRRVGE